MDRSVLPITDDTRRALGAIARRHRLRLVVAFGSQVEGKTHAGSDIDLAVLLEDPQAGHDSLRLLSDLQGLFPRQDVDVVWLDTADPLLAWEVFQRAQLLHGDIRDMLRYSTYAWRRFVEYGRFFALEAEAVRRGIMRLRHAHR